MPKPPTTAEAAMDPEGGHPAESLPPTKAPLVTEDTTTTTASSETEEATSAGSKAGSGVSIGFCKSIQVGVDDMW